ncbi:GNAT family N-acetyltransferase [Streptococcus suis]|uniref:Acetyltransferase n=1 Tax=Streptococcus suis R61 TaxID=996306 RepID=A0AA87F6K1_STRSU|nr:GNAT family N-acetyltransferase [Streptococcus suis]ANM47633.1 histone acetyltransferase HPA2 [Streptococcus phage phiJH1301-2]EHC01556.1 acetyltransferase [Streptococcus suis R61]MBY5000961.1 GNAT family N-acetyltransferase [Streptococcus suis]MBY5011975.1 GNAT family N-acetyltransferase [Streptococcus suis]MBY5018838.1 GNAT family N-acetyltransferase [Streptococcus suis]
MSKEIYIRQYLQEDFERLCQIHDPARQEELDLANLSEAFIPLSIAADREGLFDYQILVAEMEGFVVGFVAFTDDELAWLYVDREYSRHGIGTSLVNVVLKKMHEPISIEVLEGNLPALSFYKKFGFEIVNTETGQMPGNEEFSVTVHILRK